MIELDESSVGLRNQFWSQKRALLKRISLAEFLGRIHGSMETSKGRFGKLLCDTVSKASSRATLFKEVVPVRLIWSIRNDNSTTDQG